MDQDVRSKIEHSILFEAMWYISESVSNLEMFSLCRSVQLLRTTFQDHTVWQPLVKILNSPSAKVHFVNWYDYEGLTLLLPG
jgi:hypothetical protein